MFVSRRVWAVFVFGCVRAVFVSERFQAVFMSGQEFVSGRVRVVFFSGQLGFWRCLSPDMSGRVFVSGLEFASGWEVVSGCVRAVFVSRQLSSGYIWRVLSPDLYMWYLSPGTIYSMTGRKWISDLISFPYSQLFYAESFR